MPDNPNNWIDAMNRLPPEFVESSIEAFMKGAAEAKAMIPAKEVGK